MAGGDAGFARGAFVEGDLEGVLFAFTGFGKGDEVAVVPGEVGFAVVLVGEVGDRGVELLLLGEKVVDESLFWSEGWHLSFYSELF